MLRRIRIAAALVFLTGLTLMFLGYGHRWFAWMAGIQFLPSWLAGNLTVACAILFFTLCFGRLYCSVVCPLGIFQDIMIRLSRKSGRKPKYAKMPRWVRYVGFTVFIIAVIADIQLAISILDPYSSYGCAIRAVTGIGTSSGWWAVSIAGSLTILAVAFCAWFQGRLWCNSICPVGFVLSVFSRFACVRIKIDADKCNGCSACARQCKSACIDPTTHSVDSSRCVVCFDCIGACRQGAISYFPVGKSRTAAAGTSDPKSGGRRNFLTGAALLVAGSLHGRAASAREKARKAVDTVEKGENMRTDGGLAPLEPKKRLASNEPPVPFGAGSVKNFHDRCIACQLCVVSCPNGVLRPSSDLSHLMEPEMGFEKGYCRPECNVCSQVCPSGAIKPVEPDAKLTMHIGTAHVDLERCVVLTDDVNCGNCARHCPVGAIRMVRKGERSIPVVSEEICIGCGACEHLCPVRPVSAVTVNGLSVHR